MNIQIYGKKIDITQGLNNYTLVTFQRLEGYILKKYGEKINNTTDLEITLEVNKDQQIANAILMIDGQFFITKQKSPDMYSSIKSCAKNLEQQLIKHDKSNISKAQKRKNDGKKQESLKSIEDEIDLAAYLKISEIKHLKLSPCTAEEVAEKMKKNGEIFTLYLDKDTNEVNLMMKSLDGQNDYEIISTEKCL